MSQWERAAQSGTWTDRFEVRRKIAAGSFGVVYLAHDRQRGLEVALKVLREATTGVDLYRFKREFRGLADIVHPNLVTLHELHHTGDQWLFTMEYVPGGSFLDWVRPRLEPALPPEPVGPVGAGETVQLPIGRPTPPSGRPTLKLEHLENSLHQLIDGVHALHVTGRLHRDLKPSNVRVTPEGRVVLLDFGLTADVRRLSLEQTHEAAVVGTPAYMSPEQAEDAPLGPASDWYSVGVMLYEALTGRRPFDGPIRDILERKRFETPRRPRELAPETPAHLDALCMQLLSRDPAQRPDGKAILEALGRTPSAATLQLAANMTPRFVGRRSELESIERAFRNTREESSIAMIVRGSSGMGKSALVREFLDAVAIPAGALVFEGRCYQRESVPYKGLDSVIDALTTYLVQRTPEEIEKLWSPDIQALARLFPVLRRVPAIAEPAEIWVAPPDPYELRRRAFSGLRRLLHALDKQVPVVIYVDDVQWDDADAASFLADLILDPEPPAMLLIACCRLEEEDSSLLIQALRQRQPAGGGEVREIVLGGFTADEADELVADVIGQHGARSDVDALLHESSGNPLFLSELARAQGHSTGHASLDDLLADRAGRLPDNARRLFEVCAVVGRPMPVDVALQAAGLSAEGTALATLQRERLLRVRTRGERLVEPYHDRVRESAIARLTPEQLRELHRRLAESFEGAERPDAEALALHWRGAGEPGHAVRWGIIAAQACVDTYAFNRATLLYREILESTELSDTERHASKVGLAHALSNAGRRDESALVFGEAAAEATGDEQIELRRCQLEQILRRGHIVEGRALGTEVLESVDLSMPRSYRGALFTVIVNRALLRLRGLKFHERRAEQVPTRTLQRLDILWSVSTGFGMVNPVFGRALQARYVRLALDVGEPDRTVQALGLEASYRSLAGEPAWKFCEQLRDQCLAIAERIGAPHLFGYIGMTSGLAAFLSSRFDIAYERLTAGVRTLRDVSVGQRFHINVSDMFRIGALLHLGRIRETVRELRILVREAEESGDLVALRGLCGWRGNISWVLQDEPDVARHHLDTVTAPRAPGVEFSLHDYYELLSRSQLDLYTGAIDQAATRLDQQWRELEGSLLLRIQAVRIEGHGLRARVALAQAARRSAGSAERRSAAALARAVAKKLDKEQVPWSVAFAKVLRASAANLNDQRDEAQGHLREAIDVFSSAHLVLYANVARRCLGLLVGGDEGHQLVEHAEAWMAAEGIRVPAAVCAVFAPGCALEA